jgi:hypothetical protein
MQTIASRHPKRPWCPTDIRAKFFTSDAERSSAEQVHRREQLSWLAESSALARKEISASGPSYCFYFLSRRCVVLDTRFNKSPLGRLSPTARHNSLQDWWPRPRGFYLGTDEIGAVLSGDESGPDFIIPTAKSQQTKERVSADVRYWP